MCIRDRGRNELHIDDDFFSNIVTENKELTEQAKIDLAISMITLKYTPVSYTHLDVYKRQDGAGKRLLQQIKGIVCGRTDMA